MQKLMHLRVDNIEHMGMLDKAARSDTEYGLCCAVAVRLLVTLEADHRNSGRSNRDLARKVGVSPGTITNWYRHDVWPNAGPLLRVAASLDLWGVWAPEEEALAGDTGDPPGSRAWWPSGQVEPADGGGYAAALMGAELAWIRVNRHGCRRVERAESVGCDRQTVTTAECGLVNGRWLSLEQLVILGRADHLDLRWQRMGDPWRIRPWEMTGQVNDLNRHIPGRRQKRSVPPRRIR